MNMVEQFVGSIPIYKKPWFWILIAIVIALGIWFFFGSVISYDVNVGSDMPPGLPEIPN